MPKNGRELSLMGVGAVIFYVGRLLDNPDPTEQEVRIAISGNLCRCTGYQGIVAAALDAAKRLKGQPIKV